MGLGVAILANSRPFEGFIFCLPVVAAFLLWLAGSLSPPLHVTATRIVFPLVVVIFVTGAFTGYYNWRVTGNALLLPHSLYMHEYYTPIFLWDRLKPPIHYSNRQFEAFYNGWVRETYQGTPRDMLRMSWDKARAFPAAFLWTGSLPILLALPLVLRDRKLRMLVVAFVLCSAGAGHPPSADDPMEKTTGRNRVVAGCNCIAGGRHGEQSLSRGTRPEPSLPLVVG
jgi:hypothetical protein